MSIQRTWDAIDYVSIIYLIFWCISSYVLTFTSSKHNVLPTIHPNSCENVSFDHIFVQSVIAIIGPCQLNVCTIRANLATFSKVKLGFVSTSSSLDHK